MRRIAIGLLILTCLALAVLPAAYAEGLRAGGAAPAATTRPYPDVNAPCNTTLQACISGSADGDNILIAPGTYVTTSLAVTKAISLIGGGANPSAVKLHPTSSRIIQYSVPPGVSYVISNVTVEDGNVGGSSGGGIRVSSGAPPLFVNVVISNNVGSGGGGLRVIPAVPVTLTNVTVISNTSATDGGGINASGSVILINSTIAQNVAAGSGGGVFAQGGVTLIGGVVVTNSANLFAGLGGGLMVSGTLSLNGTQVLTNSAFLGGGVYVSSTAILTGAHVAANVGNGNVGRFTGGGVFVAGDAWLSGGLFEHNRALSLAAAGAGLFVSNSLTINGTDFISNTTSGNGGGAEVGITATLNGGHFANNFAAGGGGLFVHDALAMTGTQFLSNTTSGTNGGGGVLDFGGGGVVHGGLFQNNVALGDGGGLNINNVSISGTVFISNTSTTGSGGGLHATDATIAGADFERNDAPTCGGASALDVTVANTQALSNTASGDGGGICINGRGSITGSRFQNNASGGAGGGLWNVGGSLALTGTTFISNSAATAGGGAFSSVTTTVTGGSFERNRASPADGRGGGLLVDGALNLTATTFLTNSAAAGGGAFISSTAALTNAQFISNTSPRPSDGSQIDIQEKGGGLYVAGPATLHGGQFVRNTLGESGGGGGVFAADALTVSGTQFVNNDAGGNSNGGGVNVSGTLTMTNALLSGNRATDSGGGVQSHNGTLVGVRFLNNQATQGDGGGLRASGTLFVTDTVFIGNSGGPFGDAAALDWSEDAGAAARIVNSLFARNGITNGSVLVLEGLGDSEVLHVTIADTSFSPLAAIEVKNGAAGITDTIIVSHSIGISGTSGVAREDYNLFFGNGADRVGTINVGGHSIVGNPDFVNPAADDYHLGPRSQAIDRGIDAGVAVDFDGDARPFGAGFDIGFDEAAWRYTFLPLIRR